MTETVDQISSGLIKIWEAQLREKNVKQNLLVEENLNLDERILLINELEEKYPTLSKQGWLHARAAIKEEIQDKLFPERQTYIKYEQEKILRGQLALMIETGEIQKYTFEELDSLLRPFSLKTEV